MVSIKAKRTIYGMITIDNAQTFDITIHTDFENLTMIEYEDGHVDCIALSNVDLDASEYPYLKGMLDAKVLKGTYYMVSLSNKDANLYYSIREATKPCSS